MKHLFLSSLLLLGRTALAQDIPQQTTLGQPIKAGVVSDQKALDTITASNSIDQGATARYTAGQAVHLQPGFVAQAGAVFQATITNLSTMSSNPDSPALNASAYPNPFADQTIIEYSVPSAGTVQHTLVDITGNVLQQQQTQSEGSGRQYRTTLEGNRLPVGTYIYRLQLGNERKELRLIKK